MGFFSKVFTWWNGATVGTSLFTRLHGEEVGKDDAGNVYFRGKKNPATRWVIYAGDNDGSRVPPDWQAWLKARSTICLKSLFLRRASSKSRRFTT
jgi:NADH:ubiquinone oxidoreductase subunit